MTIESEFVIQVGVGASAAIDIKGSNDIRVGYVVIVTGTVTYTMQHSLGDDTYIDNDDNAAQTTSQDGNYVIPVQKVRVNVTAGTGTAKLIVRQLVI